MVEHWWKNRLHGKLFGFVRAPPGPIANKGLVGRGVRDFRKEARIPLKARDFHAG
jgi:hypothetical protein